MMLATNWTDPNESVPERPMADAGRVDRALALLLMFGGLIAFAAAFVLAVERVALLADPEYTPSCSLNPVLSCGSVMQTAQAEVFGFPNPFLGVAGFPVVAATGAALVAGARVARWYWLGLQVGVTLGMLFVGWLIFQSLYRIEALCPYCMVVWAVMLPVFWYVTLRNASVGMFGAAIGDSGVVRAAARWHSVVLTSAVVLVMGLVAEQFWYFWSTLV